MREEVPGAVAGHGGRVARATGRAERDELCRRAARAEQRRDGSDEEQGGHARQAQPGRGWHEVGRSASRASSRPDRRRARDQLSNWGGDRNTAGFTKDQRRIRPPRRAWCASTGTTRSGQECDSMHALPASARVIARRSARRSRRVDERAPMRVDVREDGWIFICFSTVRAVGHRARRDRLPRRGRCTRAGRGADSALTAATYEVGEGATRVLDASDSTDDGAIVKYEWDLDGNGSYETNAGRNLVLRLAGSERRSAVPVAAGDDRPPGHRRHPQDEHGREDLHDLRRLLRSGVCGRPEPPAHASRLG